MNKPDPAARLEPVIPVDTIDSDQGQPRSQALTAGRVFWAVGGFLCFALAVLGSVLPIIPTTPFLLAAAFCFAKSSRRLDAWFKSTKLYHKVLEGYVTSRTMTPKAKLSILGPVTLLLGISFALMGEVPVGRVVVALVWIGHIVYFGFIVKTDAA